MDRRLVLALLPLLACARTLRDHPIAGSAVQYLDGTAWVATSGETTIPATVPGDIITDLQRAEVIDDPYYELNWLSSSNQWWADSRPWTYTTSFDLPQVPSATVCRGSHEEDLPLLLLS
jgi:hypothetical protein